jgi:NhaA family Na+:H+ antiporter
MSQPSRPGPELRVHLPQISPSVRLFLATEAGGAVLLLAATVVALVWANLPGGTYEQFWTTPAAVHLDSTGIGLDLRHWVNDGAMALFFGVVGLEISREVTVGELRDRRTLAVPALGAVGGLATPALIYFLFNHSGEAAHGWGIAMSTDTAFVVGVLALFGPKCPDRLRLFLLTLAIVDDIGAITVMAIFYTKHVDMLALLIALVMVALLVAMRWAGVWRVEPYILVGLVLWGAVHASGVHATLAGVLVGLIVPSLPARQDVVDKTRVYVRALREDPSGPNLNLAILAAKASVSTNDRLQAILHPWTAFLIVPVFGLANAGVKLDPDTLRAAAHSNVTIGVAVALVVGNTVGITLFSTIALKTGLGVLPGQVRYSHLIGGAVLAGIGFTISLFIADLAFDSEALRAQAKIGIIIGSLVAAVLGTLALRILGERMPMCSPLTDEISPTLPTGPWRDPSPLGAAAYRPL